jgi:hypothetical protein
MIMANQLVRIINSISSAFAKNKKAETENKPLGKTKLYTFMIRGEGVRKSVNIKACNRSLAEQKVHTMYPDCQTEFLWELIRSTN